MLRSATTLLNTPVLEIIQLFFFEIFYPRRAFCLFSYNYKIVLCAKSEYIGGHKHPTEQGWFLAYRNILPKLTFNADVLFVSSVQFSVIYSHDSYT